MSKNTIFAAALLLADLFLFAQTPFAQTVATVPTASDAPRTAADAVARFAPEPLAPVDLSLYFSPTKIISSQSAEPILNADEWTDFYLSSIGTLDAKRFANPADSVLAAQICASFADVEPSFNVLFDALFGYCRAVWLDLTLDPATLNPDFSAFSCVIVSELADAPHFVAAALADAGYAEFPRTREMGAPRRFGRGETPEIFLSEAPTTDDSGLFVCFLARTAEEATAQKEAFADGSVFAERLQTDDATLATARLTDAGVEKIRQFFANAPQNEQNAENARESLRDAWAPGVVELAKRLNRIDFSARENENGAEIELVFDAKDDETAQDLAKFDEKAKSALEKWKSETETSPLQELSATVFVDSESAVADGSKFVLKYRFVEPEIFDKIRKCFKNDGTGR